jgi:hypothetical protein
MVESVVMTEEQHRVFAESLSKAERVLVLLRDELYGGSWQELINDLKARQDKKPFIFKLNTRIEEDLARITKLRAFEQEQEVDVAQLLSEQGGDEENHLEP